MTNYDGQQVITPYKPESVVTFNEKTRDVQKVKTAYGTEDASAMLQSAIEKDSDKNIRLYYWDKKRALQVAGVGVHEHAKTLPDRLIHRITDNGSLVKPKITPARSSTSETTLSTQQWAKINCN